MSLTVAVCLNEIQLRHYSFFHVRKMHFNIENQLCLCNRIQYIFSISCSLYILLDVRIRLNHKQIHLFSFGAGKMPQDDKDICYLSFWMPLISSFWCNVLMPRLCLGESMVEYRDLCKLFFKLKMKEIDITLIQIVVFCLNMDKGTSRINCSKTNF